MHWKQLWSVAGSIAFATAALAQTPPLPKAQVPADEKAFKATRGIEDLGKHLAALQQFLTDYPQSKLVSSAHLQILTTLIKSFSEREAEIDTQARYVVKHSGKGDSKYYEEGFVASLLADRGPKPVDLPAAEKWARDNAGHTEKISEAKFDKAELKGYKKFKQPLPTADALHRDYSSQQAEALVPLADVLLHKGDTAEASKLLDRAYTLDPTIDKVSELKGVLALNRHNDAEALADFEHALLLGDLEAPWRARMAELYRGTHGGSDAGFETELDEAYAKLYPPPHPALKQTPANGHTVLLELFTGSACGPCVGGDIAVENVLAAYPRSEIIALSFDQHIPEPDPLANEDTLARAKSYNANSTPNYFLDGTKLPFYGGGRSNANELYAKISAALDKEAALPSGIHLSLSTQAAAGGLLNASATLVMPSRLAPSPLPDPSPNPGSTKVVAKPVEKPVPPQLALYFTLVEDEVRYSGENGIRFHRMVVRSMPSSQPVELGKSADFHASFDPAAISGKLHSYLTDFQTKNDRFGKVEFLSLDTTFNPRHLAIAAWVEDTANHRVLQAAFQPVPSASSPNPAASQANSAP